MGWHGTIRPQRTARKEVGALAGVQVRTLPLKMDLMTHRAGSGTTCVTADEWMGRLSDDNSTHVA